MIRLHRLGWDPSQYVIPGTQFVNADAPAALHVRSPSGYDGQFYYRLSRRPFDTGARVDGVRLAPAAYRQQRLGFPVLVWLASLGGHSPTMVMWAMIGVNVVGVGVLAWLAARLALDHGKPVWSALFVIAFAGLPLTLARDLGEIVSAGFLLGAVMTLLRGRYVVAGVLAAAAVVTRETSLVLAGGIVASALVARRRPSSGELAAAGLPIGAFALMQLLGVVWYHHIPVLTAPHALAAPFSGIAYFLRHEPGWRGVSQMLALEAVALVVAGGAVVAGWRRSGAPPWLRFAWVFATLLLVVSSRDVWVEDWAFLRAATEFTVLSYALLLMGPPPALVAASAAQSVAAVSVWTSVTRVR